jgi:uncharacterized protein (TIGR02996 family)
MSDEVGLLDAIRESPENDSLRLVYADWLEEHGHGERAELIRVQLELAPLLEGAWEVEFSRVRALERREADLLPACSDWLAGLPSPDPVEWRFERGLPSWLSMDDFPSFHRYGRRLFRASPVERLTIQRVGKVRAFASSPLLESLVSLDVPDHRLRGEKVEWLVNSPHLVRLRRLRLSGDGLDVFGARALALSPLFAALRCLDLCGRMGGQSVLDDAGVQALVQSVSRPELKLKTLRLDCNSIGPDGAGYLAGSASLPALEVLTLTGNHLGAAGVLGLARGTQLPCLRSLSLRGNAIEPGEAALLAESPLLARLVSLDLSQNPIDDVGVGALAAGGATGRLVSLNLTKCQVSDVGALSLSRCPHLSNLRVLGLALNQITETGARHLVESPGLAALESLNLQGNPIPEDVRRRLKERPGTRIRV